MVEALEITSQDRIGMAAALAKFFRNCREYQRAPVIYANRTNAKPLGFELYWMLQDDDSLLGTFARLKERIIRSAQISDRLREFILSNRVASCE